MPAVISGQQNLSAAALNVKRGTSGIVGLSLAKDGTTATTLDITLTAAAYAIMADGSFLDAVIAPTFVSTTLTGLSVNGNYFVWLDISTDGLMTPVWSALLTAAAAPSTAAINVGSLTVGSNVITANTVLVTGSFLSKFGAIATIGSPPTIAVSTNAGVGATAVVSPGSTNLAGYITITTGTTPWTVGTVATVTYSAPMPNGSVVILEPISAVTAVFGLTFPMYAIGSKTGFTLGLGVVESTAGHVYAIGYMVIGI
jgi:hypothetical protein